MITKKSKIRLVVIIAALIVFLIIVWKHGPHLMTYAMVIASLLVYLVVRTDQYRENNTPEQFFLNDRSMPKDQFVPTYVTTNVGLFSSIAFSVILGYYYGLAGMILTTAAWFIGMYWFSRKIPKIISFLKRGTTIHEFIAESYGQTSQQKSRLRAWTSIVSAILYFASVGVEVKFGADIFAPSLGVLQSTVLAFIIAMAGLTLTYLSGYQGVVFTDKIQYYILLVGAGTVFIFSFIFGIDHNFTFNSPAFKGYFNLPFIVTGPDPIGLLGMIILLSLYQFCIMDMWQRCIAITKTKNKDNQELNDQELIKLLQNRTFKKAVAPFLALFVIWFIIGVLLKSIGSTSDLSLLLSNLLSLFNDYGSIGYFFKAVVVTGFVAALLSTVDTFLLATVQTIMYDVYGTLFVKNLTDKLNNLDKFQQYRFVDISKVLIVIFGILSVGVAFFSFGLMNFWTAMYSIMLSFFPSVYYSIEQKSSHYTYKGAFLSIIVGSAGALLIGVLGTFILNNSNIAGIAPIFAVLASYLVLKLIK